MLTLSAHIQTPNPQRLMNRLCKHWGHKFPVTLSAQQGEIELPLGVCRLHCSGILTVELEADGEQMPTLQQVVTDHLQRMAGKDELAIEWKRSCLTITDRKKKEPSMNGDSKERYGRISRLFHWGMALLIGWQLLKFFDRIADGEHWVGQTLVPWHISIGTLLLLLVVLRILWVAKQRHHRPAQNPATVLLVKAGHFLLYAAMVAMPVSGILTMLGNGYGLTAFGVQLAAKGDEIPWMASIGSLHSPIAWFLLVMIVGHVGIALLHQFVKKDGVLRRMI